MKELPKFVNKVQMEESEGLYELEIVLHQRAKNKPYNRLSHLIIKDWITEKLGKKIDLSTFEGPKLISNKSGANAGRWTFRLEVEQEKKQSKKKQSKNKSKKKTKKTEEKEEKELDNYEEMTYPLPNKD